MTTQHPPVAYACYRHADRGTYIRCQRCGRPICGECMISAAVGFQCPECVRAAAKETRQGELRFGGRPVANASVTTIVLIAINALVWVLINYGQLSNEAYANFVLIPGLVGHGFWLEPLASAFSHQQLLHLGVNMMSLWFLGPPLEQALGRARFLAVYLISALTGSTAVMWLSAPDTATLGASGAIFGLIGSLLVLALRLRGNVQNVLFWLGINLVFTFTPGTGISWQGHIGGLIGGLITSALIAYAPRKDRSLIQWVGLAGVAVLAVAGIVIRALALV